MGEIQPGDHVFGASGQPVTVTATTNIATDRPCYRVTFSDGSTITADANHLWQVTSTTARTYRRSHPPRSRAQRWPGHAVLERQLRGVIQNESLQQECTVSQFEACVSAGERIPLLRRGINDGRFGVQPVRVSSAEKGRYQARVYRSAALVEALLQELSNPAPTWAVEQLTLTTAELAESIQRNPEIGWGIPVTAPLALPSAKLPVDPWLLGYWLGDGHHASATIATADQEVRDRIEALGYQVPHYARFNYGVVTGGRGHRGDSFKAQLRRAGVLHNKHIPDLYLRASSSQRAELLAGLLDSDGCVAVRGKCRSGQVAFSNTNPQLIEGVAELAASLGYTPTIRLARPQGIEQNQASVAYGCRTRPAWVVRFTPDRQTFGIARKQQRLDVSLRQPRRPTISMRYITAIEAVDSVPVRCITVDAPDHLYLAGRRFIVTHNCRDNFSSRGATGPLSPDGARMMFDDHSVGTTIPYGFRGRGTWVGEDGHPKEVQYYYTPDPRKATSASDKELLEALRPA